MITALIVIIILLLIVIAWLVSAVRDIRYVNRQLVFMTQHDTNQQVHVKNRNRQIVILTRQINALASQHQQLTQQYAQSKSQLDLAIHNISHDLRTPLTVALGYGQLLQADASLTPTQQKHITSLNRNLNRLSKHLDLLLLYNRLIENRITLNSATVNISQVLQQNCLDMYDPLQEAGIQLQLSIEPDCIAQLDTEALNRIFQNILANILEHGHEQAKIKLTRQQNRIQLQASNALETPITDAQRLMDRFYTEDLSHKNQNAGLGLYIISELVKLQGGTVNLQTHDLQFQLSIQFPIK